MHDVLQHVHERVEQTGVHDGPDAGQEVVSPLRALPHALFSLDLPVSVTVTSRAKPTDALRVPGACVCVVFGDVSQGVDEGGRCDERRYKTERVADNPGKRKDTQAEGGYGVCDSKRADGLDSVGKEVVVVFAPVYPLFI